MNIKRLEGINLGGFIPFNDKERQFTNAYSEVTNHLDQVMEHYGLFLNEGDFERGRIQQFRRPDIRQAILLQRQITRDSWLRTKHFKYGSTESVYFWRRHRIEFEILGKNPLSFISMKHFLHISPFLDFVNCPRIPSFF